MKITRSDSKLLNELVNFTILFRFTTAESLEFIQARFRKISEACYKHRRSRLVSDKSAEEWLSHMAVSGFVTFHKENIETIQMLQHGSLEQLHIQESMKPRNEALILSLRRDIRENTKLLSELALGVPIIGAIKARLSEKECRLNTQRFLPESSSGTAAAALSPPPLPDFLEEDDSEE